MPRQSKSLSRRDAARHLAQFFAASPLLSECASAQGTDRLPPLDELINIFDFDDACRRKIAKEAYDYIAGGSDDEYTKQRNRDAFGRITFRKRLLVDVSRIDLSTTILGTRLDWPVMVAPTGTHSRIHPEAELATARGAGAAKTLMAVSNTSSFPMDQIAKAATGPLWYQLYPGPDYASSRERVERARELGFQAVLFTADAPYYPRRERDYRNRLVRPEMDREIRRRRRPDEEPPPYGLPQRFSSQVTWKFVGELCAYAKLPVLVKGVLTAADAQRSLDHGASGVVVSNHGGRYLDGDPATIEMLPEIVGAIGAKSTVLIDGGFRRGTDVLKALALGAKGVLIGRPPLWGLGAYGQAGVQRVLELLKSEVALAFGLAGVPNLAAVDRSLVVIDR
jgi:isopentenyl diphosphate isomerase/L-lactate dehydrogenase-like FMN-dependent dehydrogenase